MLGLGQTFFFWVLAVAVPMFAVRALTAPEPTASTWAPVVLLGSALVTILIMRLRQKAR